MFRTGDFSKAETVLRIEDLVVGLAHDPAGPEVVKGVSLSIRAGETVCLVGESGSGKSVTSLSVMGLLPRGILAVRSGRIMFGQTDLLALGGRGLREMRANGISMIFQEPMTALNPVMRVGDQITEVLRTHTSLGRAQQKSRAFDIMEQVGLPDVARIYRSFPHQLSGGQRQRIMIAMALILGPKLLIADEPTTALDVTTQRQILALIGDLQRQHGTAVLFITHDMGVVAEMADTVCVMRDGAVVESATAQTLFRAPAQDYTRRLLKAVPSLVPRAARPRPSKSRPVLSVRDLGKTYGGTGFLVRGGGKKAVADVSFDLEPGRTLGIVGESGSGKSTVARCIMRLIDPTTGYVEVDGRDIARLGRHQLRPYRSKFQIVFQDPYRSLNPRRTIGESMAEGPINFGVPRMTCMARAAELMEIVGLPAASLSRYPHQFSGGQRQRIAIARALAMEPDVIVADEAVSALDVSVQAQVLELLADLQRTMGIAILFITHDLRVAAQICDEVIVMRHGEMIEHGGAVEVLSAPRHEYTRSLIEAAPARGWDFAHFREIEPGTAAAV